MKAMPNTQTVLTATGTQTVLTVNEVESLVKSEAQYTKETEELKQRCGQLEQDNTRLRSEKQELREKTVLNEDFFKDDNEKVRFYTGLTNWNLLLIVIQFVQPFPNTCNRSTLPAFQQVVLLDTHEASSRTFWTRSWVQVWHSPLYCVSCIHHCY